MIKVKLYAILIFLNLIKYHLYASIEALIEKNQLQKKDFCFYLQLNLYVFKDYLKFKLKFFKTYFSKNRFKKLKKIIINKTFI